MAEFYIRTYRFSQFIEANDVDEAIRLAFADQGHWLQLTPTTLTELIATLKTHQHSMCLIKNCQTGRTWKIGTYYDGDAFRHSIAGVGCGT